MDEIKKSGGAHVDSTGIRWTGEAALFAAQLGWLMTPRIWVPELDKRKAETAVQVRQA
ncbi:hypothetical protein [Planococcus chinensis]|uniref:hypothetical protein n=1 Tax=Planococcus chinensis TaxID=272917 RepID=UPI001958B91A